MAIALGILLPLASYAVIFGLRRRCSRFGNAHAAAAASSIACLVAFVFAVSCVAGLDGWPGATQIAWSSVSTVGKPLVIGGDESGSTMGWPNGHFVPSLSVNVTSDAVASVVLDGGGAFLIDDATGAVLNGTPLEEGYAIDVGNYSLRKDLVTQYLQKRDVLSVLAADGSVVASAKIARGDRPKVVSLRRLVSFNHKLRDGSQSSAEGLRALLEWSDGVRLLVSPNGPWRIVAKGEHLEAEVALPLNCSIVWFGSSVPLKITASGARTTAGFRSPWRLSSPVPYDVEGKIIPALVVARAPEPGDYAFLLPFGRGLAAFRGTLALKTVEAEGARFENSRSGEGLPAWLIRQPDAKKVLDQAEVEASDRLLGFFIVSDLPHAPTLAIFFLVALFTFVGACFVVSRFLASVNDDVRWIVFGVSATVWSLLAFRCLLAVRYAASPDTVDALAVKGASTAFAALCLAPPLLLLAAAAAFVYIENRPPAHHGSIILGTFAAVITSGIGVYFGAIRMWPNVPNSGLSTVEIGFLFVGLGYAGVCLALVFFPASGSRFEGLTALLLQPISYPSMYFRGTSGSTGVFALGTAGPRFWDAVLGSSFGAGNLVVGLISLGVLFAIVLFGFVPFVLSWLPARDVLSDIAVPFLSCWFPVMLVLAIGVGASRRRTAVAGRFRWCSGVAVLVVAIGGAAVLSPIASRDPGALYANIAVFLLVGCALIPTAAWRWGIAVIVIVVGFVACGSLVVPVAESLPLDTARVRVLTFRDGRAVQELFLGTPWEEVNEDVTHQSLVNATEHTWQNQALAHKAGWGGFGFGKSPSRTSHIRQDTLQYDSVYSFFVVGDYGLLGGIGLLLAIAVPFALVLIANRTRFGPGRAALLVITGTLLAEAVIHAAMNLGMLPFTGRNLPFLAVNSLSDLIRWTLLVGVGLQALFWKVDPFVVPPTGALSGPMTPVTSVVEPWRFAPVAGALSVAVIAVAVASLTVGLDSRYNEVLDYGELRQIVSKLVARDYIVRGPDGKWIFDETRTDVKHSYFIKQQLDQFNLMSLDQQFAGSTAALFKPVGLVPSSYEEYNERLAALRASDFGLDRSTDPNLFILKTDDSGLKRNADGTPILHLAFNPDFDVRIGFTPVVTEADVPRLSYRDGTCIVGAAWDRGRWVATVAANQPIPWLEYGRTALLQEWARRGPVDAARYFSALSLDRALQQRALEFAEAIGHTVPIRDGRPGRVALCVMHLPTGEVLALGGWPRSAAGDDWQLTPLGDWLPPARWLSKSAPPSIRILYEGDRNFDAMVVGSASKPLWAAAALSLHPELRDKFLVRGASDSDSSVFGIEIPGKPWHARATGWRGFDDYLSYSDNRYQVRLGFLGLAERDAAGIRSAAAPAATAESMSGSRSTRAWERTPVFPTAIGFSSSQRTIIADLHSTLFAERLHNMFGIGRTEGDLRERSFSFWTANGRDNMPSDELGLAKTAFEGITPTAPNFMFESIKTPRDYVAVLLGGSSNRWSNVDFAAAFGTAVTGHPVTAHLVLGPSPPSPAPFRTHFPEVAREIRPGLKLVVTLGTAKSALKRAKPAFERLGVMAYAKTGTLEAVEDAGEDSRLAIVLVRWKDHDDGIAETGLVLSLDVERGGEGRAAAHLAQFIVDNEALLKTVLDAGTARP